jgi:hypothetical protein
MKFVRIVRCNQLIDMECQRCGKIRVDDYVQSVGGSAPKQEMNSNTSDAKFDGCPAGSNGAG